MILILEIGAIREKFMSYNMKNKNIVMIVLAFAIMIAMHNSCFAEDAVPNLGTEAEIEAQQAPVDEVIPATGDILGTEETQNTDEVADILAEGTENSSESPVVEDDPFAEETVDVNTTEEMAPTTETTQPEVAPTSETPASEAPAPSTTEVIPEVEAPKSPFERFGNAILSKVDSDLFNQMSNIEKQTTLLNLELKREELKNKVEALKAARIQAQEEIAEKKRLAEQRIKDEEAERQAMLMAEEQKIKEKEIELEKVRQAKVLNEYMNEMLRVNQDWVAKNVELQQKINELQDERIKLIADFENKIATIKREATSVNKKAEAAKSAHERIITSYKAQVSQLRQSLVDSEDEVKKIKAGNSANPFADMALSGLDENAIDMSQEYAIMDITGQGRDIIAKIVSKDGTTFIVHKGSMLKGGEVVTAITDNYIAFNNKGVKSYLYTGGTVMEYEPVVTFNGADKTPESTEKKSIKSDVKNVRGANVSSSSSSSSTSNRQRTQRESSSSSSSKSSTSSSSSSKKRASSKQVSFGNGMFVK